MRSSKDTQLDPLYVIFEQHLYNFQDSEEDRKVFIDKIVQDYFSYLRKLNISIPQSLEGQILEELSTQVNVMLIKKIYGCLSLQDYQKHIPLESKRKVKARYSRLKRKA